MQEDIASSKLPERIAQAKAFIETYPNASVLIDLPICASLLPLKLPRPRRDELKNEANTLEAIRQKKDPAVVWAQTRYDLPTIKESLWRLNTDLAKHCRGTGTAIARFWFYDYLADSAVTPVIAALNNQNREQYDAAFKSLLETQVRTR